MNQRTKKFRKALLGTNRNVIDLVLYTFGWQKPDHIGKKVRVALRNISPRKHFISSFQYRPQKPVRNHRTKS